MGCHHLFEACCGQLAIQHGVPVLLAETLLDDGRSPAQLALEDALHIKRQL